MFLLSVSLLNIAPILYFAEIMTVLRGSPQTNPFSTYCSALLMSLPAVAPAFAVFGLYRIWIAIVEFRPGWFYYASNERPARKAFADDPTIDGPPLNLEGRIWYVDLLWGILYVGVGFGLAFIP